jgi:hypothetical protein
VLTFAVEVRPERSLRTELVEGVCEWELGDRIGAFVEEHRDDPLVGCPEHVHKWHGLDLGTIRDCEFDHVTSPSLHRLMQGVVLGLLTRRVS